MALLREWTPRGCELGPWEHVGAQGSISPGAHRLGWQPGWLQAQDGIPAPMGGTTFPSVYGQQT